MKHLEFELKMPGYLELEASTRRTLMDQEGVAQMPADRASQMLKRVGWPQEYVVRAKFQEAGVFITGQWTVLIMGRSHLHCVAVLCSFLELIEDLLDTHVSIALVTMLDRPAFQLYGYLALQARLLTVRNIAIGAALLLMGGFISAAVDNWIWPWFRGG